MSTQHGPVVIKPISEVAQFQKNLIPANISETYSIKPMFKNIASDEEIRKGVIAFRDFLYIFCDCLISDGHLYTKPPKKPGSMADYPFLFNVTNLLVDIGYHGKLTKNDDSLIVDQLPLCTPSTDVNGKKDRRKFPLRVLLSACAFCLSAVSILQGSIWIRENSTQEKIAKGYGCDRKFNRPCQHSCQGIRIPLDDSILDLGTDIETWLDNEIPAI